MAKWKRTRLLETGGQAEIWITRNQTTGEVGVMKRLLLPSDPAAAEAVKARFRREVRSQSAMSHPNIMPIVAVGLENEPPFYVMPEADTTFKKEIEANAGLPPGKAVDIVLDVVEAVTYAHQQGILHRDLKPANVLRVNGNWVVGDFGLCLDVDSDSATLTQSHAVFGTLAYMAPEQFDDAHDVDGTADVFSLGRILYNALSGLRPFPYAPLNRVPAEYGYLISKATADNPLDRYATVSEFGQQLELVSRRSKTLVSPTDRAKDLLSKLLDGDKGATAQLLALVASQADDEVFYTDFVSHLPEPAIRAMEASDARTFAEVVKRFDHYSEGSHPFNYVDVIADFFARVISTSRDPMLRRLALHRIVVVGYDHNRFYVGDVVARIVSVMRTPAEAQLIVDVLKDDRQMAQWYEQYLRDATSLPPAIRALFR